MARKAGGGAGGVVVTGVEEIDRRMKTLVPRLQKKVIRQSMRKAMKIVAAATRARVPVDTGLLKASIKVRATKFKRRGRLGVEVRAGEGDFKGDTFYGGMVEYGTKRMPPRPFMAPAYDETKEQAKGVAMDEILAGIEREASRD
ncbi:MAG: hypothetical protein BGO49_21505 [Planctomycetales bacterium 71-10]|nr:MAG: hypothetical protein BGO49_21505 [Planctomycetales bacterium 71-10]